MSDLKIYIKNKSREIQKSINESRFIVNKTLATKMNTCIPAHDKIVEADFMSNAHNVLLIHNEHARAWCKTIITSLFNITSYNSFAPSPRYCIG